MLRSLWRHLDADQTDSPLSLIETRILLLIHHEHKDADGFVTLKIGDIARRAGRTSHVTINRWIGSLLKRKLLEKVGVQGKPNKFRIRPFIDPPRRPIRKLRIKGQRNLSNV